MRSRFQTVCVLLLSALLVIAPVPAAFAKGGADKGALRSSAASASDDVVSGKWIVSMDARIGAASHAELKDAGVAVDKVSRDGRRAVVTRRPLHFGVEGKLARMKGVEWVEPLRLMRAAYEPTDPKYLDLSQWGLPAVNAPLAWDTTKGASGVTIAIVDSGIDLSQPEFAGRLVSARNFVPGNQSAPVGPSNPVDPSDYADDNGHGTHVAGIATAAMDNGVGGTGMAPLCSVMPIKVLGSDGEGWNFDIGEGIRWAADNDAEVINLSLEGGYDQTVASAVTYAQGRDAVVVAAAGNYDATRPSHNPDKLVQWPARLPGVLGVSAVGSSLSIADSSNRGAGIDIAAPGIQIWSTLTGGVGGYMSGTSMASPFVAGAAALVRAVNPALTPAEVASRLMASATDAGSPGTDGLYGAGLLNVGAAVALAAWSDDVDIPGIRPPVSPVSGALAASTDTHDVYAIELKEGETIEATVTAASGVDFDLRLFAPAAQRVAGPDAPLSASTGPAGPKVVRYGTVDAGVFYLDVSTPSDNGTYTLDWRVVPADWADDDVPGITIPPSPVAGALDMNGDTDDVFRVYMEPGDSLTASLAGAPGTDFDLYLFGPGTPSVALPNQPVLVAAQATYPKAFTHTALRAGFYYLNPYADREANAGSGTYELTWSVFPGELQPDDNIPGVQLTASPVAGGVDSETDSNDVFWVDLTPGVETTITLSGAAGTDFDLYLFGPGSTSLEVDTPIEKSVSDASDEQIVPTVTVPGRYYIDVRAYSGAGAYQLDWEHGPRTVVVPPPSVSSVTLSASTTSPRYLETVRLTARSTDAVSAVSLSGPVRFEYLSGATWVPLASATAVAGVAATTVRLKTATAYRALFLGTSTHHTAMSASLTVRPGVRLGTVVAPRAASRSKYFKVYGSLRPRHMPGTYPVRVYRWRYVSGRWKSYGYVLAKASDYSSYSRYKRSIRLPYKGRWKLRAYAPRDAGHSATWSPRYDYISIR